MIAAAHPRAASASTAAQSDGLGLLRIADLLVHVAPHCPAGLLDGEAWRRLAALPAAIPAAVSIGAFECRLEPGATRVDFEACIRAAGGGRARLGAGLAELERSVARDDAGWRRTLAFLREWTDPDSALARLVPVIWLEFDLEAGDPNEPTEPGGAGGAPFVVVTLDPRATSNGRLPLFVLRTLHRALELLSGGELSRETARTLSRALDALPSDGRLLHVAIRPAAGAAVLRAILKVPLEDVPSYLDRIAWPGPRGDLTAWLARSCRATPRPTLNLDLGACVGPQIGIEHHFLAASGDDPRWRDVLGALEEAGACTPARSAQLAAWLSPDGAGHDGRLWPIERDLLVKVVLDAAAPLRAKAYLPFTVRPPGSD